MIRLAVLAKSVGTLLLLAHLFEASAEPLRLGLPFGDHMVLQRGDRTRVWGHAMPDSPVELRLGEIRRTTRSDETGRWSVHLGELAMSTSPRDLRVGCGEESVTIRDVLVGDVWICAGQSNMRWPLEKAQDARRAIASAADPGLRLFDLESRLHPGAGAFSKERVRTARREGLYESVGWRAASSASVSSFSAVAYFFGAALRRELDVPIGLIHNAVGGVPMEAYIPRETLDGDSILAPRVRDWLSNPLYPAWCRGRARENLEIWIAELGVADAPHPFAPGILFEQAVLPFTRSAIRGVIWYQGESNATVDGGAGKAVDVRLNKHTFAALIRSWREAFESPNLPFYFVQLPGLERPWVPFREAQLEVARDVSSTGMAVTIDVGQPHDVHPRQKRPVGERLARLALARSYGLPLESSGPLYRSHRVERRVLRVEFDHVGEGLATLDDRPVRGLEIAGVDRVFHAASALVDTERDELVVWSRAVAKPVAVRYAWRDDPDCNMANENGVPASPFRSDRWLDATRAIDETHDLAVVATSFEEFPPGRFRDLRGAGGTWTAGLDHAEIDPGHASSGSQCLHILGGRNRQAEFTPELDDRTFDHVSFRAERWTRNPPFRFRVEALTGDAWSEVYNGDREVTIRRFPTQVGFRVPRGTSRLRFTCTAPTSSGVLIDDLELRRGSPMRLVDAAVRPIVAPALIGVRDNPVLELRIETRGALDPLKLEEIHLAIPDGVSPADIASVRVLSVDARTSSPHAVSDAATRKVLLRDRIPLRPRSNVVRVGLELSRSANIESVVGLECRSLAISSTSGTRTLIKPVSIGRSTPQRVGVLVRRQGQDSCHTYRIPGLATTNRGTLIAVYDCRYTSGGDLPNPIDVGMSRSTDGGQSWEPMRVIMDMGSEDEPGARGNGIGDPAILVDRVTGRVWVAATWSHGNRSWHGSGPGLSPDETGQLMLAHSDDDGLSWSQLINITRQVKNPKWRFVLQGPGKGITLRDGTLVFPAQFRGENESPVSGRPFSTLIWSADRGATWSIGEGVKIDTTEAQLVELADASIMINCRDNRGGSRTIATTRDLGASWTRHRSSRSALPEPVCMASLIRLESTEHGALLVFSNPATPRGRRRMTVKVSQDEGESWPRQLHTLCDERFGAYSCLTRVGDARVGLLYEGTGGLVFVRMALDELLR